MYHSGDYLEQNPTWHVQDSPWKAQQVLKLIEKHRLEPRTVCEVGCGAGEILNQLHNLLPSNTEFYGYEISSQAYELACRREKPRLRFYLKDLLQENAHFDLLLVIDVFEHVEDYMGFLKQLSSKASYALFHIPLELSVATVVRGHPLLTTRNNVGHLHYFTKGTALATLQDTGYEVIDYIYTGSGVELNRGTWKHKLARWPRGLAASISTSLTSKFLGGFSLLVLTKSSKDLT